VRNAGILYHPKLPRALALARQAATEIERLGGSCWINSAWEEQAAREKLKGTDLLITLGGDGTLLRASRIASCMLVPILSVNFGKLGFLAELQPSELIPALPFFLADDGWVEERIMLNLELPRETHAIDAFGTSTYRTVPVSNDVVVARGTLPRMICAQVSLDGTELTTYKCDGLIIATPTGSTAYSLSAGGPILHPKTESVAIVPVAPHLCFSAPLVVPSSVEIEVRVKSEYPCTVSVDGQIDFALASGEAIRVRKSEHPALYLRRQAKGYFYRTLVAKLKA